VLYSNITNILEEKMKFERKIMNVGGSTCLILPPDVVAYLGLENGTVMEIQDEEGKHGKYISVWKKKEE
jgi:antitoxin component of MazEF toxin-antitoxin module|tara:strand:+ start:221 stop:427 length:207 start_codon:yes stop_codon:yes gene_type:complete